MKLYNKLAIAISTIISSSVYASTVQDTSSIPTSTSTTSDTLEVLRVIDKAQTGEATSCLVMSSDMSNSPQRDVLNSFISLTNKSTQSSVKVNAMLNGREICLTGLEFGTEYDVTLKQGLKSDDKKKLSKDETVSFTTIDHNPTVSFLPGNIIPLNSKDKKVAVQSVGTTNFKIALFKISTEDLNTYDNYPDIFEQGEYRWEYQYEAEKYLKKHAKFLATKSYSVDAKNLNNKQITMVDLKELTNKDLEAGIYALLMTDSNFEDCDNSQACVDNIYETNSYVILKQIVISDLGLTTYKSKKGIDVAVRSITNAKPIANANVKVYSKTNDVLAQVQTDKDGYAHIDPKLLESTYAFEPKLVKVINANDVITQNLDNTPLFLDNLNNVADISDSNDYNIYAYTNRTLVRPGEKVYYSAIVRNKDLDASNVKVMKLMIYRPDGVLFKEVTLKDPIAGAFDYEFEFEDRAILGSWTFSLGFDKNNVLSRTNVQVDNFIPSTIKPSITSDAKNLTKGDFVKLHTQFIYDAPAPKIVFSGSALVVPDHHPIEKYKEYYFGPNESENENHNEYLQVESSETDANGNHLVPLVELSDKNYPRKVNFNIYFTDPNSKSLFKQEDFNIAFNGPMIGVKNTIDSQNKQKAKFDVILANQDGTLSKGIVSYSIFKLHHSYQFAFYDNRWHYIENNYQTPVISGSLDVKDNSNSSFDYNFSETGEYVINLDYGDRKTSNSFFIGSLSEKNTNYPDRFDLFTDKKEYKVGDTAILEFDSQYDGYADLLIDNNEKDKLSHYVVKKGHNKIEVKISDKFKKGSYAVLSTYSSTSKKLLGSQRSIGVAYLELDTSDKTLVITSNVPEKVIPNSGVDIELNVEGADDNTYVTAALIDNGILSINNQKDPQPDKELFKSKIMNSSIYDFYNFLMKNMEHNGQGYGDDGGLTSESLANITKELLSYYTPKTKVQDGKVKLHYDLKDVSSTARLIVVAWSPKKLGSFNQEIKIADNTVSKLVKPNYLHSGDEIVAKFTVNNLNGESSKYNISINCNGAIECKLEKSDELVKSNEVASYPITLKAIKEGDGFIDIKVNGTNYTYKTTKELPVLSPYAQASESKILFINPGETVNVKFNNTFKDGSQASIVQGRSPFVDSTKMIDEILDTKYFNVIDITSAGLTVLSELNKFEKSKNADEQRKKVLAKYVDETISNLQSRVFYHGELSGYFSTYDERLYATAYICLYLHQANQAGFNVNKSILASLKGRLQNQIVADNDNVAAISMYVLAQMGVNVRSNLVYKFDNSYDKEYMPIEAMTYYANTFGLYGDTYRRDLALKKAQELVKRYYPLVRVKYEKVTARVYADYISFIIKILPFRTNTLQHDTLAVARSMLIAKKHEGLDDIFAYLQGETFYDVGSTYMLVDSSNSVNEPVVRSEDTIKGNTIKLSTSSKEPVFATVNAFGYVTDSGVPLVVRGTQEYYTTDGRKLTGDLTLNVNDDVIVVNTFSFEHTFEGDVSVISDIPANTVFVRNLSSYDMERIYPKIDRHCLENSDLVLGDSNVILNARVENSKIVKYAYLIKAAHQGTSVPIMSTLTTNRASQGSSVNINTKQKITVK